MIDINPQSQQWYFYALRLSLKSVFLLTFKRVLDIQNIYVEKFRVIF